MAPRRKTAAQTEIRTSAARALSPANPLASPAPLRLRVRICHKDAMTLHLIKLCVGADSIADLEEWIAMRIGERARAASRRDTLTSPAWLRNAATSFSTAARSIGSSRARSRRANACFEVEPFVDADGVGRCRLWLDPAVVPVSPRPMRAFQGWRYLAAQRCAARSRRGRCGALRRCPRSFAGRWANSGLL